MLPHFGYEDGEEPEYGPCPACEETVRIDRLDLLLEHAQVRHRKGRPRLRLGVSRSRPTCAPTRSNRVRLRRR